MSADIEDYGYQKSLQEILEELSFYCQNISGNGNIQIILLDKVIDHFNLQFMAKQRLKIEELVHGGIHKMWYNSGIVELLRVSKTNISRLD